MDEAEAGQKYLELNRSNFLLVYLMLKDKNWDASYLYCKLVDIFGPPAMSNWECLFEKQTIKIKDLSKIEVIKNILPTLNLAELERIAILAALDKNGWQQKNAARELGISPRSINYRINLLGITHPQWKTNREESDMDIDMDSGRENS